MVLLREGAQGGKVDGEGKRALELAPDGKVSFFLAKGLREREEVGFES